MKGLDFERFCRENNGTKAEASEVFESKVSDTLAKYNVKVSDLSGDFTVPTLFQSSVYFKSAPEVTVIGSVYLQGISRYMLLPEKLTVIGSLHLGGSSGLEVLPKELIVLKRP